MSMKHGEFIYEFETKSDYSKLQLKAHTFVLVSTMY